MLLHLRVSQNGVSQHRAPFSIIALARIPVPLRGLSGVAHFTILNFLKNIMLSTLVLVWFCVMGSALVRIFGVSITDPVMWTMAHTNGSLTHSRTLSLMATSRVRFFTSILASELRPPLHIPEMVMEQWSGTPVSGTKYTWFCPMLKTFDYDSSNVSMVTPGVEHFLRWWKLHLFT